MALIPQTSKVGMQEVRVLLRSFSVVSLPVATGLVHDTL